MKCQFVSNHLPRPARDLLVSAALSPATLRRAAVDTAIDTVKTKYPRFFQLEQHHGK